MRKDLNAIAVLALSLLLVPWSSDAGEAGPSRPTPVEHVKKVPQRRGDGLATMVYVSSQRERPFFERLDADGKTIGGHAADYDLKAPGRSYVGWFGIVREVDEDAARNQTRLTVEHKYFDGLTDSHIQALSFNGGGDFRAVLSGVGLEIPPLSLVRIYGTLRGADDAGRPTVNAEFVRNWHWGTFTFLSAYGTQKGSDQWRRVNRVDLERIYDPYPNRSYYEERLGKRSPDDPLYRRLLKAAGPVGPDTQRRMIELVDSLQAENLYPVLWATGAIAAARENRPAAALLLAAIREEEIPSWSVCSALGQLAGREQVPLLLALLRDEGPEIRARAVQSLGELRREAASSASAVVHALGDANPEVRKWAATALVMIEAEGTAPEHGLKVALKDPNSEVRVAAASALWGLTFQAEPSLSVLLAILKDGDKSLRCGAASELEQMGPAAAAAGPALIAATRGDDQYLRYAAVVALGAVRPEPKAAVPALAAALKDQDSYVRSQAARALGRYGPSGLPAVPSLIAATKDEDDHVRWSATEALGEIGPSAKQALPVLVHLLKQDRYEFVRGDSIKSLVAIDRQGQIAIPALTAALSDSSASVRQGAAEGLGQFGDRAKSALPALRAALKGEERVRITAAKAIWQISGDADTALPILIEALGKIKYQALAAYAVGTLGPAAKSAVPSLIPLLGKRDVNVPDSAAEALGKIGPEAMEAVPALVQALQLREGNSPCAVPAAEALWKINRHARAIPTLIELLPTDAVLAAAEALGRIGPAAAQAVPALRQVAKNRNPEVRRAADEALQKVSGRR